MIEERAYSQTLRDLLAQKPLTTDAWVQCDACQVWRRVPNFVATKLGEHEQWFCHKNFHQEFSTCDDPQELIDDEIDVLMKAQEKENKRIQAEEIGRKILEEDEEDERELLGGTRGDEEEEEEEKKKKKKGGAGGWKKKKDFDESDDDEDAMCKPIGNAHVWSRVSRNIFKHREPRKLTEDDIMVCNCVIDPETGSGCGEECVNRLVLTECDPKFCPCSTACKNQRFSRKEFKGIEVKRSSKKGHGLFSKENIKPGEFVLEYVGEVLHEEAYEERKRQYAREKRRHFYFMTLSSSETIDATIRGGVGRFLNHSCDPNCETQKWMVKGELCIGVFALREIQPEEEITIDYKFERYGEKPMRCFCETAACCGWIGGAKAAREAEKYANDSEDEDEENIHLADETPVMLECDEDQIIKEEKEARLQHEQENGIGGSFKRSESKKFKDEEKKWRPPEEQKAYDRAKKAREKKYENEEKQRLKAEKRSMPSFGGGARSRVRAPAGSYAAKWGGISSASQRRSEIDVAMDDLRNSKGALRNEKACLKSIQMFNLAYPVDEKGESQVSERDLGLLLEAISMTGSTQLQRVLVERGGMGALQTCISRLGGALCSSQRAPLLRKVLRVLGNWLTVCKEATLAAMRDTKTARGSFFDLLGELRYAKDSELQRVATEFANQKVPQGTIVDKGQPESIRRLNSTGANSISNNNNGMTPGGGFMRVGMGTPMGAGMPPNGVGFRTGTPPPMRTPGSVGGFVSSAPPGSATTTGGRGGGFNSAGPPPPGSGMGFNRTGLAPPPRFAGGGRGPPGGASSTPGSTHQRDAIGRALPSGWKSQTPPAMAASGGYQNYYNQQQQYQPPYRGGGQYPPYTNHTGGRGGGNDGGNYNGYNNNGYYNSNNGYNNSNTVGSGYARGSAKRQRMDANFSASTPINPPLPPGAPPPRSTDAPSAPKRNGNEFDDPHSLSFASIVNDIVQEFAMEYRARNHPRHAASADYDALQKKWQTKILTNEQKNFEETGRKPIELTRLRDSINAYVKMANEWEFKNQSR